MTRMGFEILRFAAFADTPQCEILEPSGMLVILMYASSAVGCMLNNEAEEHCATRQMRLGDAALATIEHNFPPLISI